MHADFLLFPPIFDGHVDASTEQVVLHVVELRNIQAAKRILARRRRQKLKLALLRRAQGRAEHSSIAATRKATAWQGRIRQEWG